VAKRAVVFDMPNGKQVIRSTAYVIIRCEGFETIDEIVLGQMRDPYILGARTLAGFGAIFHSQENTLHKKPLLRANTSTTAKQLIAEGNRLCRPCLDLVSSKPDCQHVAIWGGDGVLKPGPGPWQHWITLDCDWLNRNGFPLRGIMSVYTHADDMDKGLVIHNEAEKLPLPKANEEPLFGCDALSFPPIEAVFRFAGPPILDWLNEIGYRKNSEVLRYRFPDVAAEYYESEYQQRDPLYIIDNGNTIAARVGGWHYVFDDDWEELNSKRLILTTYRDSEPWIEVYLSKSGEFEVKQRIT